MPYNDTSRYQLPFSPIIGGELAYLTIATLEYHITDITGLGHVLVEDVSRRQYLTFSSDLGLDTAVAGIGGMHDAYPVAADTWYELRCAWDPLSSELDGDFGLVNLALVQALTGPGAYTMWSPPLGMFVTNTALQIVEFALEPDGWLLFLPGHQVLTAGVAIAWTAVDCSDWVPNIPSISVQLRLYAESSGVADRNVSIGLYDGATEHTILTLDDLANIAGSVKSKTALIEVQMTDTPATFLVYDWDVAPSHGLDVWVTAVKIG